jgi:hypothetical protein
MSEVHLHYNQHRRHACNPTEAVAEQDLENGHGPMSLNKPP